MRKHLFYALFFGVRCEMHRQQRFGRQGAQQGNGPFIKRCYSLAFKGGIPRHTVDRLIRLEARDDIAQIPLGLLRGHGVLIVQVGTPCAGHVVYP